MGIGGSLVVIAIGAILRFAVYRQDIGGVNVGMIGTILLIVGIVGPSHFDCPANHATPYRRRGPR
jgi:hypothetical protein